MKIIDVGGKFRTKRRAKAVGKIRLKEDTLKKIIEGKVEKGDVLGASKIAGITGAKKTPDILPFCHPVSVDHINIDTKVGRDYIEVVAEVEGVERTGYEMEALTAVTTALLNIYDMCKGIDDAMVIEDIRLVEKSGGKRDIFSDLKGIRIYTVCTDYEYLKKLFEKMNPESVECIKVEEFNKVSEERALFITFFDSVPQDFIEARIEGLEILISEYLFEHLGIKGLLSPIVGFTKKGLGLILMSREKEYVERIVNGIVPLMARFLKESL